MFLQLQRANKLKERLEGLCRELQRRNKALTEEMRLVSLDQQRQHKELKEKFEHSLEYCSALTHHLSLFVCLYL